MKKIYFVILSVLSANSLHSQSVVAKDRYSLQTLSDVIITDRLGQAVITDKNGNVSITNLALDSIITIRKTGYSVEITTLAELEKSKYSIFLTEKPADLSEVVVSASKFEEKRKDVPQQMQVIQVKELEFMSQQSTADVMQQSGNIMVQKSQMGGGSPILRGFEANKVLIVVDGVRMNNAIFRGGHLQNIITLDNSILDRAEITYGPGSVVYGSDALGGVMHFYTKKPILADSGRKSVSKVSAYFRQASANRESTAHVDASFGTKKFGFLSSITYSDFNDLKMGSTRSPLLNDWGKLSFYTERINGKDSMLANNNSLIQKNTGYKQLDLLQKLIYKPNRTISHELNLQYSKSSDIPRYDRLTEVKSNLPVSAVWYYGPQKRFMASYTLSLLAKKLLYNESRLVFAYQNVEESRINRNFGSQNLNTRNEKVKLFTINWDFNKNIGKHEIRYGLDLALNTVDSKASRELINSKAIVPLDTRYPDGGSTLNTYAVYVTHAWELSEKLILTDGLRFSTIRLNATFNDTSFFKFPFKNATQASNAFNGNLGLVYMPSADWRFALLGSSGFRAPNIDDLAKVFETKAGSLIVPNDKLKPEYIYNVESTISKIFDKKVRLENTFFYSWFIDAITTQKYKYQGADSIISDGKNSAIFANQNARNAFIYGASVGLFADVTKSFSISSTVNYTYGRIKTDSVDYPLDHIAPVFGKTAFLLKIKKIKGEFWINYSGAKNSKDYNLLGEDNQQYSFDTKKGYYPAWYTFNVRLAYSINQYTQFQIAIENILDQYYRTFASGLSAPGRNFMFTLRVKV